MATRRKSQLRLLPAVAVLGTVLGGCEGSIESRHTRDGDGGRAANEAGPGWVCGPDDQCTDGSYAGPCFDCRTGCCAAGDCRPGTEDTACGKNGEACQSCAAGTTCDAATGTCVAKPCDPSWCKRCCDATTPVSRCIDPPTSSACGLSGAPCKDCGAGMFCDVNTGNCSAVPPTCDASTCSAGCCTTSKQCIGPSTATACGLNGAPCKACASSQTCSGGQCVCQNTCSSAGARECASQYMYRVCTVDGQGCLSWNQDLCQSGYKCQGAGQCVCENYCTPGVTQCADRFSFTKCEDLNGDGCTDKPTAAKQCKNEDPPFFRCVNTSSSSVTCVCADENCIIGSNYNVTGWMPGGSSAKDVCYYCSYSASKCTRGTMVTNTKWCTGAGSDPTAPYCNLVSGSPVCQKTSNR